MYGFMQQKNKKKTSQRAEVVGSIPKGEYSLEAPRQGPFGTPPENQCGTPSKQAGPTECEGPMVAPPGKNMR